MLLDMSKKLFSCLFFFFLLGLFAEKTSAQASGVKPELVMYRHNGGGVTPAPVADNDLLGTIRWKGLTAIGNIRTGASIESTTRQVSTGYLASEIVFRTTTNLSDPQLEPTKRMIIDRSGLVGIGTMSPQFHLDVLGNTHTAGDFFGRIHMDPNPGIGDAPNTYLQEAYFERKPSSDMVPTTGLTDLSSDGGLLTLAPSLNGAGPLNTDHQLFFNAGGIFHRKEAANGTAWTAAWEKLLTSGDINGRENMLARYMPPGPISSKLRDGQVFDNGTNVVIGGMPAYPTPPTPVFDIADALTVTGRARVDGNTHINGNIGLGIAPSATDRLDVSGTALLRNNTRVSGNLGLGTAPSATDRLDVSGTALFRNDTRVNGILVVGSAVPTPPHAGVLEHELYVGGSIEAEEVVVKLMGNWPDYVMAEGYDLKPLSEVEAYMQQEKHLPGVPSASEVAEKGIQLGEMQKTQMEKIEELYLHMISLEKRVNALEVQNKQLQEENTVLKSMGNKPQGEK